MGARGYSPLRRWLRQERARWFHSQLSLSWAFPRGDGADLDGLTWACDICGAQRPDDQIAVFSVDISGENGLPPGTMARYVRFCNDRPACMAAVPGIPQLRGNP